MKRLCTRALLILAVSAAPAPSAVAADGELLIGYVDLQRAIQSVEEGRQAKSKLEETAKKKQAALNEREEELKKLQDALQAQQTVASGPEADAKRNEFLKKLQELQKVYMKEQQELAMLEQQELSTIQKKMKSVIEKVGERGGYTLILEVQGNQLLYAKDHLDLTNEVIRKYNARYKSGKGAGKP